MKVKLHGTLASPRGSFNAGSVVDFPDAEARRLVKSGQAEPAEEIETAVEAPAGRVEKAVQVQKRRGRLA